jgi:hypothetical protein
MEKIRKTLFLLAFVLTCVISQGQVNITLSMSETEVQILINNASNSAVFQFEAGRHIPRSLYPKTGQTFQGVFVNGNLASIISGAAVVSSSTNPGNWYFINGYWVLNVTIPYVEPYADETTGCSTAGCNILHDLFVDNKRYTRVTGTSLASEQWSFDKANGLINQIRVKFSSSSNTYVGKRIEIGQKTTAFNGNLTYPDANGIQGEFRDNVTIKNLIIEKFASQAQFGAITSGKNWIIDSNVIRWNHGGGIRFTSNSADGRVSVVRNNYVYENGQIGIVSGFMSWEGILKSQLSPGFKNNVKNVYPDAYFWEDATYLNVALYPSSTNGGIVEANTIIGNNYAGYNYGWEAGGTKFTNTTNLKISRNYVYRNHGPGLWTDINNKDALIEANLVEENDDAGIFHEISFGGTIRCNISRNNKFDNSGNSNHSQLLISSTNYTSVLDNRIEGVEKGPKTIAVVVDEHNINEANYLGRFYFGNYSYIQNNVMLTSSWPPRSALVYDPGYNYYGENFLVGPVSTYTKSQFTDKLTLTNIDLQSNKRYFAIPHIETSGIIVTNSSMGSILFSAWQDVILNPGFETSLGTDFTALTSGCIATDQVGSNLIINGTAGGRIATDSEVESKEERTTTTIQSEALNVYPVPSGGMINIVGSQTFTTIRVIDLLGVTKLENVTNAPVTEFQLDLTFLPKGAYIIKFIGEKNTETKKIILQ